MNTELKCGYCGFKGNTQEDYACQTCDHDPWWAYIPYETSTNSSALDEFKSIIDFKEKRKVKTQAHDEYDFN